MVSSYLITKYCNKSGFALRVLFLCYIKLETSYIELVQDYFLLLYGNALF